MPCSDITELVNLTLDADDRVVAFSLAKNTCGAPVSSRLELESFVSGRPIGELMTGSLHDVVVAGSHGEPQRVKFLDEFMLQKQLTALRKAIAVYDGADPGGKDDAFALASIDFDGRQTVLTGLLRVDLVVEEIEACGGCASCATPPSVPKAG